MLWSGRRASARGYLLRRRSLTAKSFASTTVTSPDAGPPKEAVTKALGCGLIQWNGVEVMRRPRQAPTVRIFGKIKAFADAVGVREEDLSISITHSELSAIAVCIIRRNQGS